MAQCPQVERGRLQGHRALHRVGRLETVHELGESDGGQRLGERSIVATLFSQVGSGLGVAPRFRQVLAHQQHPPRQALLGTAADGVRGRGLAERLLKQRHAAAHVRREMPDAREPRQGLGPTAARWRHRDQSLQQLGCGRATAGLEAVLRLKQRPATLVVGRLRGRQVTGRRAIGFGCVRARAASERHDSGRLDVRGDAGVGTGRGKRQVPGSFHVVGHDLGQPRMQLAPMVPVDAAYAAEAING